MTSTAYSKFLPCRPYCRERKNQPLKIVKRGEAMDWAYVQPNSPMLFQWLILDLDVEDSWERVEYSGLPHPTYIACTPDKGTAHAAWLLESPVVVSGRAAPKEFYQDIEVGFTRRLGADTRFHGPVTKNPLHPQWHTDWQAKRPWRLDELNDVLEREEKKTWSFGTHPLTALGRNCFIFDAVRKEGYRDVRAFKRGGKTREQFQKHLLAICRAINHRNYQNRLLTIPELAGIAKSAAKFTWKRFTEEKFLRFDKIQAHRGRLSWSKTETLTKSRPWEAEGISRRTWFRRRKNSFQAGSPDLVIVPSFSL